MTAAHAKAQVRDEFHPSVTGHRMLMQHRIAEMEAASRLAEIRRQLAGPPAPRACDRITPTPAPDVVVQGPVPDPVWTFHHWYWDDRTGSWSPHPPASWSAPTPAWGPVWRPRRRSLFGWLRLLWVASWVVLFAYGLLIAALVEVFE